MRSSELVLNQLSSQRKRPCAGGANSSPLTPLETGAAEASAARQKTDVSKQGSLELIVVLLCNRAIRFAQENLNRAPAILKLPRDARKSIVAMKVIRFSYAQQVLRGLGPFGNGVWP